MKFAKTCLVLANPHGRALELNEAHAAESGMFSSIVRMETPTADGLLRWRDPDCPPARLLARKPDLQCLDSVRKVLAEIMAPQHYATGHKRLDGWEMTP